jgi:hypothetical protein
MKKLKVVMEIELDDSMWGFVEYIKAMRENGATNEEIEQGIVEILMEDLSEVTDGALWKFDVSLLEK